MAKLNDLIRRATRTDAEPMGFGAVSRKPQPTMLIVALISDHWSKNVRDSSQAGVDAFLLLGRPGDKDVRDAVEAADGKPCGLLLGEASLDILPLLRESGLDFVAVGPNAPAAALLEEELALVLHVREELTDLQLRALEAWPLDALYIDKDSGPTTIARLLELQRLAGLSRKPLLVQPPVDIKPEDLRTLRDAGTPMLGVDFRERNAIETVKRLRVAVDGLPRQRMLRKEEKVGPLLPTGGGTAAASDDDEDDD
jgi:hypothetical protein